MTQLYRNVVAVAPRAADLHYYFSLLRNGMGLADLLVLAGNLNNQRIDLNDLARTKIEYS